MPEQSWEKTATRKSGDGAFATMVKILTLGIAANPEPWEVEYTNRKTGELVRATGATEEEADANARARFTRMGGIAAAH
jgi:hypothetical protein